MSKIANINSVSFIVVEKNATIKEVVAKNFNKDDIYKKCGFRKSDGFECHHTWESIKIGHTKYTIQMWGKDDGKAGTENKYDFPPPIETKLLYGGCALLMVSNSDHDKYLNLSKDVWLKIYENLFGGFEDIVNEEDDEIEVDELTNIKKEMKTKKTGYVKDGFVVDSDEEVDDDDSGLDDEDEVVINDEDETESNSEEIKANVLVDSDGEEIDCGSELEKESYSYGSDDE
jgi:hypothetical protein